MSDADKTWWFFFPLRGLSLSGEQFDKDHWPWGDAKLMSPTSVRNALQELNLPTTQRTHSGSCIDIADALSGTLGSHEIAPRSDAFVVVRRNGVIPKQEARDKSAPEFVVSANQRASHILAALAIAYAQSLAGGTILTVIPDTAALNKCFMASRLCVDDGSWSAHFDASDNVWFHNPPKAVTSLDVAEVVVNSPHLPVLRLLLEKKGPENGLQRSVIEGATLLSDAICSMRPAARLLGCVTSIEVALGVEAGFKQLGEWAEILTDWDAINHHTWDSILKARHAYVHQGRHPDPGTGQVAVEFALNVLKNTALSAERVKTNIQFGKILTVACAATKSRNDMAGELQSMASAISGVLTALPWKRGQS